MPRIVGVDVPNNKPLWIGLTYIHGIGRLTAENILKEAKEYLKNVKLVSDIHLEQKKDTIVLTEDHIREWLEVFYEDRIRMDTCNQASVKQ